MLDNKMLDKKQKGFTLVELSIVLVIIGLIVAGIVAGQELIKSGKIQAQISDLQKYESAFNAFRLEYNAIPGDMLNASAYWSGATVGNGDGKLTQSSDSSNSIANENIKFFEHLSRARLVEETFTNVWRLGSGYPILKIDNSKGMTAGGYVATLGANFQLSNAAATATHIAVLYLNASNPQIAGATWNDDIGTASPIVYYAIDKKIDDGVARAGKFQAHLPPSSDVGMCLTGVNGDYLISNNLPACHGEYLIAK